MGEVRRGRSGCVGVLNFGAHLNYSDTNPRFIAILRKKMDVFSAREVLAMLILFLAGTSRFMGHSKRRFTGFSG